MPAAQQEVHVKANECYHSGLLYRSLLLQLLEIVPTAHLCARTSLLLLRPQADVTIAGSQTQRRNSSRSFLISGLRLDVTLHRTSMLQYHFSLFYLFSTLDCAHYTLITKYHGECPRGTAQTDRMTLMARRATLSSPSCQNVAPTKPLPTKHENGSGRACQLAARL